MAKIHLLPDEIISKIAAGEVIERPASVVKELLENSLDAGAADIEIHVTDAGKTSITVKDNGSGIEHGDLKKIFSRHATSKISSIDDLYHIHSLGFRGEALYSIAAIADVQLRSSEKSQPIISASACGFRISGACRISSHRTAFRGIPGPAQGEA